MAPTKLASIVLTLSASSWCCYGQEHSIVTNLQYRLTQGDLGELTPAPFHNTRTLRIEEGGELLIRHCSEDPVEWAQDRMFFRLAHRHALSSTSCRERSSPSMHVVSHPLEDASIETRIHFDLHGPNNPLGHFGELVRNRLTFGRTSEYAVYRGLVQSRNDPDTAVPAPAYDFAAHAGEFYRSVASPSALASAVFAGAAISVMSRGSNWGSGHARYDNRMAASLAGSAVRRGIEFGVAAALQQDETFRVSQEERFGRRMKAALYNSMFVPGRGGDELAFPRIAAAVGTGWTVCTWHPWTVEACNPWVGTALILSKYVLTSYWHEFRPDIKHQIEKRRRAFQRP